MGPSSIGPLRFLPVLLILSKCQRVEWDAANFPNPTAGDFKRCNMRTTANICDPDGVLTESQRYRLNHELHQLESRTRQVNCRSLCHSVVAVTVVTVCCISYHDPSVLRTFLEAPPFLEELFIHRAKYIHRS